MNSQLGDIIFNVVDEYGVEWALRRPAGWFGAPDTRTPQAPLPLRDGTRVGDAFRTSRVINLHGGIAHRDRNVVEWALDRLIRELDLLRADGTFVAYEEVPKQASVRRTGGIDTTWHGPVCEWSATLVCPDPRRYATNEAVTVAPPYSTPGTHLELTTSSGTNLGFDLTAGSGANLAFDVSGPVGLQTDVEAFNFGSAESLPIIEFLGPSSGSMTSFKLTNLTTGVVTRVDTSVNAGQVLVVDMAAAYGVNANLPVTLGGASRYANWVQPREPMVLLPGANVLRYEVLTGTPTDSVARVHYRSAWE